MLRRNCLLAAFFLAGVMLSCASGIADATLLPIKKKELVQSIQKTPIESPQQGKLISRAADAHLLKTAYEQYTLIWQKQPDNASANLRRGVTAMEYWEYATKPAVNELPLSSPQADEISDAAATCLAKSVELAPKSASAKAEYGNFLFYQGNMNKGVQLLKEAEALAPKAPTSYELLGAIYASPNPPFFQPKLAEKTLGTAIRLDPLNSYPHWVLAQLYSDEQRYGEAQKEMQTYLNLAPPERAQESYVTQMQSWIARGLNKK
jgi:tetratricopeptide (TPR) repeat protein